MKSVRRARLSYMVSPGRLREGIGCDVLLEHSEIPDLESSLVSSTD
jgi:hypothetical protein